MTVARSSPPPAIAHHRAKAVMRPNVARLTERNGTRDWFAAWCRRHNVSARDLSAILGVSLAIAQAKLTGERPVGLHDISKFPPRFRSGLLLEFAAWCSANDNDSSHS